jgi:hypothetical protein
VAGRVGRPWRSECRRAAHSDERASLMAAHRQWPGRRFPAPGAGGMSAVMVRLLTVRGDALCDHAAVDASRVHYIDVSSLQFVASLVASLSWPVVVMCALIVFRHPISELVGRVRSYKGLGQEVSFGEQLAAAESSVEDAINKSEVRGDDAGELQGSDPSPLVVEAENNPSFVVIRAWEQVQEALAEVFAIIFPEEGKRRTQPLSDLERKKVASREYFTALRALRDLRNRVAHGHANPTPGEAVAYAESAAELAKESRIIAHALAGTR